MEIKLRCINEITPVFSWVIKGCSDKKQVTYLIKVRTTDRQIVWDSGEVISDTTVNVLYGGSELEENTKYFWNVVVTTENAIYESEESYFITGLYNCDSIKWISPDADIVSPIIYKEFEVKSL